MTPASKDEQRCGGMALPAERQGEPRPAKSLPADSPAAHRVSAGRRQCEDAVGMWHDAFTEECIQQAAFETPSAVERIQRRQPRCRTAAQCLRSCHEVHIGIGLIPRTSREGGSLAPPHPIMPLSPTSHISGKFCDNSFCAILQNKQSENITSLA